MSAAKSNSPTLDRTLSRHSAVLVPGYTHFGGKHNETATVKRTSFTSTAWSRLIPASRIPRLCFSA